MHLGLPVDGNAVTGSCERNWDEVCEKYLGKVVPKEGRDGNSIKFSWLEKEFLKVPEGTSSTQLKKHFRAYVMLLIGGVILPDKSSNRVHMKYLPLLHNIDTIGQYSWGSACLANLYRMLCTTSTSTKDKPPCMGGCTLLMQSWVWSRMPFMAPEGGLPIGWPLAKRWDVKRLSHTNCPRSLVNYRDDIDHMREDQFIWWPYIHFTENPAAFTHSHVWTSCTALVCFHMVEWHHADRVMLQFGLVQEKPLPPTDMTHQHTLKMQGRENTDWEWFQSDAIGIWNNRYNLCVQGRTIYGEPKHSDEYKRWFLRKSIPFLSDNQHLRDPRLVLLDLGSDTPDEEEEVPPMPNSQTERRERNKAKRAAAIQRNSQTVREPQQYGESSSQPFQPSYEPFQTPFHYPSQPSHEPPQYTPQFEGIEQFTPHRHSVYNASEQYTPLQEPHRHSTSDLDASDFDPFLGFRLGSTQALDQLHYLQQEIASGSSSRVPQFLPEQPPTIPTEEQQQPPIRRSKRPTKPTKCGTGGHKHH